MDRPEMTQDSVVQALVITSSEEVGPRNTRIDNLSSEVIDAFYQENPDLVGDSSFAALYLSDTMPAGAMWGWVQRDGQRIMTIQYAVHEQLSSGGDGYTDCGLVYTIQNNLVAAIRAYGLNVTISADQVQQQPGRCPGGLRKEGLCPGAHQRQRCWSWKCLAGMTWCSRAWISCP